MAETMIKAAFVLIFQSCAKLMVKILLDICYWHIMLIAYLLTASVF
jgi:hypothetical protein